MRKLIVSMNVTLDGFLSGPHCELDWHLDSWSGDMAEALAATLSGVDTLLLGRTTYTAMAQHWAYMAQRADYPREDIPLTELLNRLPKIVATQGGVMTKWGPAKLMGGPLERSISELKNCVGKNILVLGSARLVADLQALRVVDEYHLWLHPTAIGTGKSLFGNLQRMQLITHDALDSGAVRLVYAVQ